MLSLIFLSTALSHSTEVNACSLYKPKQNYITFSNMFLTQFQGSHPVIREYNSTLKVKGWLKNMATLFNIFQTNQQ